MWILLIVVVLFFLSKGGSSGDLVNANQISASGTGPAAADSGKSGLCAAIGGHVERKNALAPAIASGYTGLPSSITKPLTNILGKLSLSSIAEQKIGDAVCSGDLGAAASAVGHALSAAGKFVANEAVAGAKAVGGLAVASVTDPGKPLVVAANLGTKGADLASRAAQATYNKVPAPFKLAVAPVVAVTKVTATVAGAAGKATGALASGAKAATSAVSSGVSKVLGWL